VESLRNNCPYYTELEDFVQGKLDEKRKKEIDDHLSDCCFCCDEVEAMEKYPEIIEDQDIIKANQARAALN